MITTPSDPDRITFEAAVAAYAAVETEYHLAIKHPDQHDARQRVDIEKRLRPLANDLAKVTERLIAKRRLAGPDVSNLVDCFWRQVNVLKDGRAFTQPAVLLAQECFLAKKKLGARLAANPSPAHIAVETIPRQQALAGYRDIPPIPRATLSRWCSSVEGLVTNRIVSPRLQKLCVVHLRTLVQQRLSKTQSPQSRSNLKRGGRSR